MLIKYLWLLVAILIVGHLVGCSAAYSPHYIFDTEYKEAQDACKDHEGVDYYLLYQQNIESVYCFDGHSMAISKPHPK